MNKIVLVDLDGTLADYNNQLITDLNNIASPLDEPLDIKDIFNCKHDYIEKRRHMITSQTGWWLKLKKFKLGFDILNECKKLNLKIVVLTKGPARKFNAWSEKVEWCDIHLKDYIDGVTITNDKSLVYGKVLVDDYPPYIEDWLKVRPRGLVIMPAHDYNKDFKHSNVIRYDGNNLPQVIQALKNQFLI